MNSIFRQSIRKDIDKKYIIGSQKWLTEATMNEMLNMNPTNCLYFIRYKSDPGIDKVNEVEKKHVFTFKYVRFITY